MTVPASKVLVIDDEPPIRKLLRMGLSSQGYEVLEASNGKMALDLLAKSRDGLAHFARQASCKIAKLSQSTRASVL